MSIDLTPQTPAEAPPPGVVQDDPEGELADPGGDEDALRRQRQVLLALCVLCYIALCLYCPLRQHAAPPSTPVAQPLPPTDPPGPPAFRAVLKGGQVLLTGNVPDEATRQAIVNRTVALYGSESVIAQVQAGAQFEPRPYLTGLGEATALLASLGNEGAVTLAEDALILNGEVENVPARDEVLRRAAAIAGSGLRVVDRLVIRQVAALQRSINEELAGKTIEFAPNSTDLTQEGRALLDQLLPALARGATAGLLIAGHTDDQGAEEINLQLSQRRARTVLAYLVEHGLPKDRLRTLGYGPRRPIADNGTPAGRQRNRRIEFVLNPKDTE